MKVFSKKVIIKLFLLVATPNVLLPQGNTADCSGALILCEKKEVIVKALLGPGDEPYELGFASCSKNLVEKNTIWIKWMVEQPGEIGFVISPLQPEDDFDFILYKIAGDIWNCSAKREIRCMAAGAEMGKVTADTLPCSGKTGLKPGVHDLAEEDGCADLQDNFLSSIYASAGDVYALYINNFSSDNGFKIVWNGDATFAAVPKLPDLSHAERSGHIFFKPGDINRKFVWDTETVENAKIASVNPGRAVSNVFVGCNTGPASPAGELNEVLEVGLPYPNPVAATLSIPVKSPAPALIKICIYNTLGNLVTCKETIVDKGEQNIKLPFTHLHSGLYFLNIQAGAFRVAKKIVVLH